MVWLSVGAELSGSGSVLPLAEEELHLLRVVSHIPVLQEIRQLSYFALYPARRSSPS